MSYKIRYGFDSHRPVSMKHAFLLRSAVSCVLFCITGLCRCLGMWDGLLRQMLCAEPTTVAERAVAALAGALTEGKGWYWALAVWCRAMIDGSTV